MAKGFIDKFLNTENRESLENSEGAIYVHKNRKVKEFRKQVDTLAQEFNDRSKTKNVLWTEIKELEKQNLFKKLFKFRKFTIEKKRLESMIAVENGLIDKTFEKMGPIYKEMVEIEKEVTAFKKAIRMYGLTLEEIEEEYEKALRFFDLQEHAMHVAEVKKAEVVSVEENSNSTSQKKTEKTTTVTPSQKDV